METILISAESKSDIKFLLNLTKKLGMSAKSLTNTQKEDWELVQKMEASMKTASVSRAEIMKALGK